MNLSSIFFETSKQRLAATMLQSGSLEKCTQYVMDNVTGAARPTKVFSLFSNAGGRVKVEMLDLFERAGERQNGVLGSGNGSADRTRFCDAIMGPLVAQQFPHPLFAVIDHNSGHHWSYVLADYAFRKHGSLAAHKPRIVINFDAHRDGAAGTLDKMTCSNWGAQLLQDFNRLDPTKAAHAPPGNHTAGTAADAYLVIGMSKGLGLAANSEVLCITSEGFKILDTGISLKQVIDGEKTMNELLNAALRELSQARSDLHSVTWHDCHVYFTLDRDFMLGSCTPYGDGVYAPASGRPKVQACLTALKTLGATLVGADVCGLPTGAYKGTASATTEPVSPNMELTQSKWSDKGSAKDTVDRAVADIDAVYTSAAAF